MSNICKVVIFDLDKTIQSDKDLLKPLFTRESSKFAPSAKLLYRSSSCISFTVNLIILSVSIHVNYITEKYMYNI